MKMVLKLAGIEYEPYMHIVVYHNAVRFDNQLLAKEWY